MNWPTICPSVRESLLRDCSIVPPDVDWRVNALPDPAEIFGAAVPMPTLPELFQIPEPGKKAEEFTVKYVVEALVIVPLVDQTLVAVRLVEEAWVKVAVVENRVGAVRMEVEALTKLVCPETVKSPPR